MHGFPTSGIQAQVFPGNRTVAASTNAVVRVEVRPCSRIFRSASENLVQEAQCPPRGDEETTTSVCAVGGLNPGPHRDRVVDRSTEYTDFLADGYATPVPGASPGRRLRAVTCHALGPTGLPLTSAVGEVGRAPACARKGDRSRMLCRDIQLFSGSGRPRMGR